MMINFSCTNKVLKRLTQIRETSNEKEEINFYNWYVDQVNIQRKNYWLFTHSQSLFSLVLYVGTKKQIKSIENLFEEKAKEMLIRQISTLEEYAEELLPKEKSYIFTKTNSRSVLGSMNDFKDQLKFGIRGKLSRGNELEDAIVSVNQNLNNCPMKAIKYRYPKKEMKVLLENRLSLKNKKSR